MHHARPSRFYRRAFWVTVLLFVAVLLAASAWVVRGFYTRPLRASARVSSVYVQPKMHVRQLVQLLEKESLLSHARLLSLWLRVAHRSMRIQVGEYRITPGLSVMALLDNMQHGRVWVHQVRFIEGWTWRQCAAALASSPALVQQLPRLGEKSLQSWLDDTHPNLEGLLAPNTYFYAWPSRDVDVVRRAYLRRQKALALAWSRRAPGLWYRRPYQALIVASLIERETALASERSAIAAVILNRLKKRMRLQVDPTVNYGLALPYGQALTRVNLRTKNPYNTYTRYGLPPTPIAMPSQASIVAALHPAQTDALYYVARKDGSHVFTRTYMDHLRAKQRFYPLSSVEQRYYDARQP